MAEKAKQDPRVQRIVQDAHLFDGLREHAGWRRLLELVQGDKSRFLGNIARRLMSGQEVSQREIDFHRGFYAGAQWIIERPEEAEANLEKAARWAWAWLKEIEAETEEESEKPYG